MKRMILIILILILVGCDNTKEEPIVIEECEPEVIYEYESYMGILVDGKDRSHLTDRGEIKEGIDTRILGTWVGGDVESRVIIIYYEDGTWVIIAKDVANGVIIFDGKYTTIDNYLSMIRYGEGPYEIIVKDGVEVLSVYYGEEERVFYSRVKYVLR